MFLVAWVGTNGGERWRGAQQSSISSKSNLKRGSLDKSNPQLPVLSFFILFLLLGLREQRRRGLIFCCHLQVKAEPTEIAQRSKKWKQRVRRARVNKNTAFASLCKSVFRGPLASNYNVCRAKSFIIHKKVASWILPCTGVTLWATAQCRNFFGLFAPPSLPGGHLPALHFLPPSLRPNPTNPSPCGLPMPTMCPLTCKELQG